MSTYRPFASGAAIADRIGLSSGGFSGRVDGGEYLLYQVVTGGDRQASPWVGTEY
ncbi:hypothetical protein D3C71_1759390 [compost metagenome]